MAQSNLVPPYLLNDKSIANVAEKKVGPTFFFVMNQKHAHDSFPHGITFCWENHPSPHARN